MESLSHSPRASVSAAGTVPLVASDDGALGSLGGLSSAVPSDVHAGLPRPSSECCCRGGAPQLAPSGSCFPVSKENADTKICKKRARIWGSREVG